MAAVEVRALALGDCAAAAVLLGESYEERLHKYLLYCQEGIAEFLRDRIQFPSLAVGRTCLVAVVRRRVVGFAEWTTTPRGGHHLSHLCVGRDVWGTGVGRTLMRVSIDGLGADEEVTLDVFTHNERALRLYRRLGLGQEDAASTWVRADISDGPWDAERVAVVPAVAQVASLQRYGFGTFEGRLGKRAFTADLMGTTIRMKDAKGFEDVCLHRALRGVVPSLMDVFYVAAPGELPSAAGEVILRSVRMRGSVGDVRRNLQ